MNVLSLFDGLSGGSIALDQLGVECNYYASEIDKYAIKVSNDNYPNIKHIGDINNYDNWELPKIDLLIGGSPCQGFSVSGKHLNFKDERSKLFFKYVELLKKIKPKYFLLENVKMKKEYQDTISKELGVEPIHINSNLLTAQNRKRLYWSNIPNIKQPKDKKIMLKDIIHENENSFVDRDKAHCIDASYAKGGSLKQYFKKLRRQLVFEKLTEYIVPVDKTLQILDKEIEKGKMGYFRKDSQANRVYYIHDKAVTLCGEAGGGAAKMGQYLMGCISPDRINKRQNGQKFNSENKFYTLTKQDRHGILIEGYIRKLTPVECERLQGVPDNYTKAEGISNTQRYKMLGNGFTIPVIKHILKEITQG